MGRRIALAGALLASCVLLESPMRPADLRAQCDRAGSFAQAASCMAAAMRDPRASSTSRDDPGLQLFVAYSQALAERVRRGQMTEAEARYRQLELQRRLDLDRQQRADAAGDAAVQSYLAEEARRRGISCTRSGTLTSCQ